MVGDADQLRDEIEMILRTEKSVAAEQLAIWMSCGDIGVRALAFVILVEEPQRVVSLPDQADIDDFMIAYLEQCIRENPDEPNVHSRYVAGHSLGDLFRTRWTQRSDDSRTLEKIRSSLERLSHEGGEGVRDAVVTAVLEHLFDRSDVVRFFSGWRYDSALAPLFAEGIRLSS